MAEKKNKKEEEFNEFLDILDPKIIEKYESELSSVFQQIEKDEKLTSIVEELIENCHDIPEIHSKLILVLKKYISKEAEKDPEIAKSIGKDEKKFTRDITELSRKFLQEIDSEPNEKLARISRKDRINILDKKAKKNMKDRLQDFIKYEIYKIMNPKRIAGETSKANYKHNLLVGGEKLASKYEGGTKKYVERYGSVEMNKLRKQVDDFKKKEKGGLEKLR